MVFFTYQRYADFARTERLLKSVQERMMDDFLEEKLSDSVNVIEKKAKNNSLAPGKMPNDLAKLSQGVGHFGEIYVFGENHELMYAPESSHLAAALKSELKPSILSSLPKQIVPGRSVQGEFNVFTPNGAKVRFHWRAASCRSVPLTIVAAKDMRAIDISTVGNINRMRIDMMLDMGYIFLLMVVVVLLAIRFAYVIANNINGEVKSLTDLCESGIEDDASKPPFLYRFKEFLIISKAIKAMSEQIRELLLELKNTAVKSVIAKQIQSGVLSNITHDLIGKLNNIMGIAQILKEKEDSRRDDDEPESEFSKQIRTMLESGRAMNNLLKSVNYIAALDTDEFPPAVAQVSLSQIKKEIVRTVGHSASERNQKLEWISAKDVPDSIKTDKNFLRQILTNLLELGIYANCKGPLITEFSSKKSDSGKIILTIKTILKGMGYTQSQLDEILKFPFVSRKYASAGLRLAICKRFAEILGGSFEVETVDSEDLSATTTLIVDLADADAVSVRDISNEEIGSLRIKVLAVDDDQGGRQIVSLMLKSIGIEVQTAEDGAEALKILREKTDLDIVLMDCEMPGLNGYDTVKEIRNRERETGRHIPIVAMTGYTTPQDEERCMEAGMDGFLPKPLIIDELKIAILRNIRRKK